MTQTEPVQSVLELITALTPYELRSAQASIILGVSVAVWLVVARVFMGLFNSDRGIISAIFASPLFLGLGAYGVVEWQVVPQIEAEWARKYLGLGVMGLVLLLGFLLISGRCFRLSATTGLVTAVFASDGAVGGLFAAKIVMETIEAGTKQIEQRDQRNQKDIGGASENLPLSSFS